MANYVGATQNAMETNFLGGLDTRSTMLNIGRGKAESVENFDLANDGSLTSRSGYTVLATLGTPMRWLGKYTRIDTGHLGEDAWVCVAGGKIWSASDPASTWTDITGSVTFTSTANPVVGASFRGRLILVNGVDAPVCVEPGMNARTLEAASKVEDPTYMSCVRVSALTGSDDYYAVTAYTPRGETKSVVAHLIGPSSFSTTQYVSISWEPVAGAFGYRVYRACTNDRNVISGAYVGKYLRLAELPSDATTWSDVGTNYLVNSVGVPYTVSTVNSAYNTPDAWNTDGPPEVVAVVAEGRDERLFAAKHDTVWSCALANPLDWFATKDAFAFTLVGGKDRNITGIGQTFEYTLIGSNDTTWVYTGAGPSTINCAKILPVGIRSHASILSFGTDLFFWSQYGPTSMTRILSGADLAASTDMQASVNPTVYNSGVGYWNLIAGHVDTPSNRLIWWFPSTSASTSNDGALVYQANSQGFTTYADISVVCAASDSSFNQYLGLSNGNVVKFGEGNLDGSTPIRASYRSRWWDMQTWAMRKRVIWFDVVMDRSTAGNYSMDVLWSTDYGKYTSDPITLTPTTTDGMTIESTGSSLQLHRVFANAYGNGFQVQFSGATTATGGIKVLGLRPDARIKGTRR